MGRGGRQGSGQNAGGVSGESAKAVREHHEFIRTGLALPDAAVAAGREAIWPAPDSNGRRNSQDAEEAFLDSLPKSFPFGGATARVITSMPDIGWEEDDERFWVDFAIDYKGKIFPYNFKYGSGTTRDNVGSDSTLAYLLGNPIKHPLLPPKVSSREEVLPTLTANALLGKTEDERFPYREYFIYHSKAGYEGAYENSFRSLAISQLKESDLYINRSNGIQVSFGSAEHVEKPRSRAESRKFIASKVSDLLEAQAAPWKKLEAALKQDDS